jgi:hypothetical protein
MRAQATILFAAFVAGCGATLAGARLLVSEADGYSGCLLVGVTNHQASPSCPDAYFLQTTTPFVLASYLLLAGAVVAMVSITIFLLRSGGPRAVRPIRVVYATLAEGFGGVSVLVSGAWLMLASTNLSVRITETCQFGSTCVSSQSGAVNELATLGALVAVAGLWILGFSLVSHAYLERTVRSANAASGP